MNNEADLILKKMICFLPDEGLAGNFFRQVHRIYTYQIRKEFVYYLKEECMLCEFYPYFVQQPNPKKQNFFSRMIGLLLEKKKNNFLHDYTRQHELEKTIEAPKVKLYLHNMKDAFDYPDIFYSHFAARFLAQCEYHKKTRVAIITGEFLATNELIHCLQAWVHHWNFLTLYVFDKDARSLLLEEMEQFIADAEVECGLVIQVTDRMYDLVEADVILDCSSLAVKIKNPKKFGTKYFMLDGSLKKARNMRRISGQIQVDSITKCLDRAFHNKV